MTKPNGAAELNELDSVTLAAMRLCVSRWDRSVSGPAFMELIRELVHLVVRDATADEPDRELAQVGKLNEQLDSRSTGAAEAEPKADIHTGETDAASVTPPAAPSTSRDIACSGGCGRVEKVGPKTLSWCCSACNDRAAIAARAPAKAQHASPPEAAPTAESVPAKVQHTPLAELDSTRDAALDRQCTDCGAGQGELHADGCARLTKAEPIAVPPPGPRPGPGRGHRAFTDEQKAQINRDYRAARKANGGEPVRGWVPKRAAELGVSCQTIYRALDDTMIELMTDAAPPSDQPAKRPQPPDDLPHTETPACWCRRKRASRDNVWCKLRTIEKPASQHAALRAPEPRVRRIIGTRY